MAPGYAPEEAFFPYGPLMDRLAQDGFDADFLSRLFTDPRAEAIPELMTLPLTSRETTDLYAPFLTKESILSARTFLRKNQERLCQTEERFGVEKEIIVAILLVESRFGENIGRRRVLPTLASIALTSSMDNLQRTYQTLQESEPEASYELLEMMAKRRADWAYRELKCFLQIIRHEKMDPLEVKGSYAGALGMAQFLPSSYLAYALNDKSFEIWLSSKEAAFVSIGNYLKSNGWKKGLSSEKKRQVLWSYNRSAPYGETILQLAQALKSKPARSSPPKRKPPSPKSP